MSFSFNPLWKMIIDKGMTREKMRIDLRLSPSTMAKLSKGENVTLNVLDRICNYFECPIQDIVEHIPDKRRKIK